MRCFFKTSFLQPYSITCTVTITAVDLSTATTTTDNCVIKNAGGVTQETIDLNAGTGTSAMYYTAGTYTLEGTVVIGATTYTGSGTVVVSTANASQTIALT